MGRKPEDCEKNRSCDHIIIFRKRKKVLSVKIIKILVREKKTKT